MVDHFTKLYKGITLQDSSGKMCGSLYFYSEVEPVNSRLNIIVKSYVYSRAQFFLLIQIKSYMYCKKLGLNLFCKTFLYNDSL